MPSQSGQIFISYSKKDSDFAHKLADDLTAAGFEIWIDRSIGGGEQWRETIEKNLKAAGEVVIVVSPNSMASEWVKHEGSLAYGWGKQLIPILIEPVDSLPPWLDEYQWIDFVNVLHETAFDALVAALTPPNPIQDLLDQQVQAYRQTGALIDEAILRVILDEGDNLDISNEAEQLINYSNEKHLQAKADREEQQQRELAQTRKLAITQRRSIYILASGLAIAIILGVVAFVFFRQAENRRVDAERKTLTAQTGQLASIALSKMETELDLALLLSVEAIKMQEMLLTQNTLYTIWNHNLKLEYFIHGHNSDVTSVSCSSEGRLATASGERIILWDLENRKPTHVLPGGSRVAWSPNGLLASASGDTVIIWDVESGEPIKSLQSQLTPSPEPWKMIKTPSPPTNVVKSVAWSPNGQLASASSDKTITLWDPESSQNSQILYGHTDAVEIVAWSPDGRLASGSQDGTVIIWNLESGLPAQTLQGHSKDVTSVAWSAEGWLVSGSKDNTIILWDLISGQPAETLHGHTGDVTSMVWSTDDLLASASQDNTVIIWDLESGEPAQILQGHTGGVLSLAWVPDGRLVSASWDDTIIVWDLESGKHVQALQGSTKWVAGLAWSPNGLLASTDGNNVVIWDLESNQPTHTLQGHGDVVGNLAWSRDGLLASASLDESVIIWDLKRGQPAQTLQGHTEGVVSVAWVGNRLVTSDGNSVIVWDLENSQPANTLQWPIHWESMAWSSDGSVATTDGETVNVWSLGSNIQTLQQNSFVLNLAWSPSGRLATANNDGTVIVWDLESGQPAQILQGHTGGVLNVAWSPDEQLASMSTDDTIIIWEMNPDIWIDQSCQRAGRNLTKEEWNQYLDWKGEYHITCPHWPAGE